MDPEGHLPAKYPTRTTNALRLISVCLMGFGNGLNDSAPGALLPWIQVDYGLGYAAVSMMFVANALGYLCSAPLSHLLETKAGRSKAYATCMALMGTGYIMLLSHPPFYVVVIAFWFIGFGESFDLALNNVFCANFGHGTSALGALHGSYGAGGTIGPLVATTMISRGTTWSWFYGVALTITFANGILAAGVFRRYEDESAEREPLLAAQRAVTNEEDSDLIPDTETHKMKDAILNRTTLLGAVFIFAYQGAEVSISGWMIEFLISYRHGDPSVVGYVTAGFWCGITLGRFFLSPFAHKIGEKTSVWIFTAACVGLQAIVWFMRSILGDSIAVLWIGLLLGPVYPCAIAVYGKLVHKDMQLISLSFISAMGSSGGAVIPMLTGILAQSFGTIALHPLCVGMYSIMLLSWMGLPKIAAEGLIRI